MGDPSGIGPDIALDGWLRARSSWTCRLSSCSPIRDLLRATGAVARPRRADRRSARRTDAARVFARALPVVPLAPAGHRRARPARRRRRAGDHRGHRDARVALVRDGRARARRHQSDRQGRALRRRLRRIPAIPNFSANSRERDFGAPALPVMMLWSPELAVVPVTIHVPLATSSPTLDDGADRRDRPHRRARSCARASASPRRASRSPASIRMPAKTARWAARTSTIIAPAVARCAPRASTRAARCRPTRMFHASARATYDAAICMYHDQALIPIKTLAFDSGVNVTLGLPFVRTSPDHGTAFDIAGTGAANPASLIAALRLADAASPAATQRSVSGIDDLPPLRDVIARTRPRARRSRSARTSCSTSTSRRDRARRRPARRTHRHRDRPRPRRADARAARRGRAARHRDRARRALPRGARGDRRALSRAGSTSIAGDALDDRLRRARARTRRAARCASSPTCPTISRTRAADRLARERAVAAAGTIDGADVPARGGRAHRRDAGRARRLRPPRRARAAGARRRASSSTCRPPPSRRRPRSPPRSWSSCRAPNPCRAIAATLERVTPAAFGQRRKMLRQSLKTPWRRPAGAAGSARGITETARAEEIDVDGFVALANALSRR